MKPVYYNLRNVLVLVMMVCITPASYGNITGEMEAALQTVKRLRGEIQIKTLQVLTVLKRIDELGSTRAETHLKIIADGAPVRETNTKSARVLYKAQYDEEFPVLDRIDEWHQVRLRDDREGWILETDVQEYTVTIKNSGHLNPEEIDAVLNLATRLRQVITTKRDSAVKVIAKIEETYNRYTPQEKQAVAGTYTEIQNHMHKITEYFDYATLFTAQYASRRIPVSSSALRFPGPVNGRLSIQLGNSAYSASSAEAPKSSTNARSLDFMSTMQLSDRANLIASFNHRSTIIQTPFSSTNLRLGFDYVLDNGGSFNSFGSYGGYSDEKESRNDFNQIGAGVNLRYPFSDAATLTANASYDGKSYSDTSGNSYGGVRLLSSINVKSGLNTNWTFGLNGSMQSSDISYLAFNRIMPFIQFLNSSGSNSFGIKGEFEFLGYAEEAKSNTYTREQLAFMWANEYIQRNLTFTGKQFSFNDAQSYVRAQAQMRLQSRDAVNYSRTNLSILYNYFTSPSTSQSDYSDFRADHSRGGGLVSIDMNLFSRFWMDTGDSLVRDHIVDMYGRVGFQLPYVNVGPIIGAHLLVRNGEKFIKRDGNSLRAGIDARSMFTVMTAMVSLSVRYEKSFVYGNEIWIDRNTGVTQFGALTERHPTTLQFAANIRLPVLRNLELTLDMNRYDINPDVNDVVSINPGGRRYQFNLLLGLGYRFGIQP